MTASEYLDKPETIKIAMLLNFLGPESLPIYNTFMFDSNSDADILEEVVKKFEAYCTTKTNSITERVAVITATREADVLIEVLLQS